MKTPLVAGICALAMAPAAIAESRTRTAVSGQTTRIVVTRSWNRECVMNGGVVKVLIKPRHGKLTNRIVDTTVPPNRTGMDNRCLGKPIKGFQVDYTSIPGFHGTDTFTLEVTSGGGKTFQDDYTVIVQ